MNWLSILKNQQVLPTSTFDLALTLTKKNEFEQLLRDVESAEALNLKGVKTATSFKDKATFEKNQFVKAYSQLEGTSIEQMWDRMQQLLEAIEPKLGKKRETLRDKLISANRKPQEYRDFIEQLKENPLTAEEIRELKSAKAKEAYRKIVGMASLRMDDVISALEEEELDEKFIEGLQEKPLSPKEYAQLSEELREKYDTAMKEADEAYKVPQEEKEGYTLRFNFRAGEGVSKNQFERALDLLASSEKITRKGNDLVFDTDRAEGVRQLLESDTRFRPNYDKFLRGFMQRLPKGEKIALPKTRLGESLSSSLLTDKEYTPKSNLGRADFLNYLEIIGDSNVSVEKYLPKSRGAGKGIADEVYLGSKNVPTLSPYGQLVLGSDFSDNWKEDFFGNVKLSTVFSKANAEQAVITDILETLRATPENQRENAKLYGTFSLAPFAKLNLERRTKKRDATQVAREAILKIIKGSQRLKGAFSAQTLDKQKNLVGQMQKDETLLTISEAKEAQRQFGGEITYYDSSQRRLTDLNLIDASGIYARVSVDNRNIKRSEIEVEEDGTTSNVAMQQIRDLLENPTDENSLYDIVMDLVEKGTIQKVTSRTGRRNRLEQASVENGLVFLIEMAEQYGDSTLKEALDKAISLGTLSREELRTQGTSKREIRRELEETLEKIDEAMPKTLESYKTGMLEALSVKLAEIGRNYEKFVGQNPQGIETVIRNLVNGRLLEE